MCQAFFEMVTTCWAVKLKRESFFNKKKTTNLFHHYLFILLQPGVVTIVCLMSTEVTEQIIDFCPMREDNAQLISRIREWPNKEQHVILLWHYLYVYAWVNSAYNNSLHYSHSQLQKTAGIQPPFYLPSSLFLLLAPFDPSIKAGHFAKHDPCLLCVGLVSRSGLNSSHQLSDVDLISGFSWHWRCCGGIRS